MRILMVCTDAEIGGAERFLATLASAKRIDDKIQLVVLMGRGALSQQLEQSFDKVHYLNFSRKSRNLIGMIIALKRAIRAFQPDVISSHLFHADLVTAMVLTKIPKTTTVHTQGLTKADHQLTRLIAKFVGFLSFRFDAVIPAGSSQQMSQFIKQLQMKNVVSAIANCAEVPKLHKYNPKSRVLISLARNHPVKGHRQLFEAFVAISEKFPNWSLASYGKGVDVQDARMLKVLKESKSEHLVKEGKLILGGQVGIPEKILANAAGLVISSIYGEAFPIVGAEAAGLGVPVITTDLGSCAEFADDKRFVVPPNDVISLAKALQDFMSLTDQEREELSNLARERAVNKYRPQIAYERYRQVFLDVMS